MGGTQVSGCSVRDPSLQTGGVIRTQVSWVSGLPSWREPRCLGSCCQPPKNVGAGTGSARRPPQGWGCFSLLPAGRQLDWEGG